MTAPGIAWVLGYTIAAELGDIGRLASPKRLVGYTGLCPGVYQSGGRDHRRPVARNGSPSAVGLGRSCHPRRPPFCLS
jgi:transposase